MKIFLLKQQLSKYLQVMTNEIKNFLNTFATVNVSDLTILNRMCSGLI
jgi:hypothetical protein